MEKELLIKVCGLSEPENIIAIDALGVDFIGLIFYPKSPRYIVNKIKDKENFFSSLSKIKANKTGVFVNDSIENILNCAVKYSLDIIQLHGNESPEFCAKLKSSGYKVIKALRIESSQDMNICNDYCDTIDYFLFDTHCKGYGGSGKKFNWKLLNDYNLSVPFFLSGGIGRGDELDVLSVDSELFKGIDLNSRFELEPAYKDVLELDEFITRIRNEKVMNRIDREFLLNKNNRVSVYFTAGFPEIDSTEKIILELDRQGADMIEIGIPFSDPMADGVVIQESSGIALKNGMNLNLLFSQLKNIREKTDIPLILMGYLNPIFQYGIEEFCISCKSCGIDGVIIPDLPFDVYMSNFKPLSEKYDLKFTMLITPETTEERIKLIDENSSGFIYMVSTASTTGAISGFSKETADYFKRVNSIDLKHPRMIGFGISNQETYNQANLYSNGAIIGSYFIKLLKDSSNISMAVSKLMKAIGRI